MSGRGNGCWMKLPLMPIGVETLRVSGTLPFDLYMPGERGHRAVLYRHLKELPVYDSGIYKRLQERGKCTLYIPARPDI